MRRCPVQHIEGGDDHQGEEQRVVVEDGECGCLILGNLGENWMLINLNRPDMIQNLGLSCRDEYF